MPARQASLLQAQSGVLLADMADHIGLRAAAEVIQQPGALDAAEREIVVEALLTALGGAYCHLPQKRAGYASDPVQALQLLRGRVADMSDAEFHLTISGLVVDLRDAHTSYSGPASLEGRVAVLPFLVEQYGAADAPSFLVTKVSGRRLIKDERFRAGVLLESWNGIPFARAVEIYADRETGGRSDARRARALESLTLRSLRFAPPPDEMWVDVGFREGPNKPLRETRVPWRVVQPGRPATGIHAGSHAALRVGINPAGEEVRRGKKLMFSGKQWLAEKSNRRVARDEGWLKTDFPDVLSAKMMPTPAGGKVGYLRIWTFDVEDHNAFVAEVARLLALLPDTGLIIDVRGNPGGLIWAAERLLQLFTPGLIEPTRFSLVATPLTRAMARSPFNRMELEPWISSLESAVSTGETYSQALPITDPAWCNDLGQVYGGPVICVADANTYSSGDLFCAGFVDNGIGPLICVGMATGAGGANVWTSEDMSDALDGTPFALPRLPKGVRFTMSFRRAVRAGDAAGVPIEDLGVAGLPYAMSRRDILEGNADLIDYCVKMLSGAPQTRLAIELTPTGFDVITRGLDELEVYLDGRPIEGARKIVDGTLQIDWELKGNYVEFVGRMRGDVVQRRRISLTL